MLVRLFGTAVNTPVVGFHTVALLPSLWPSHASISPVLSRLECTATIGQAVGAPGHCPAKEVVALVTVTETGVLAAVLLAKSLATAWRL